MSTLETVLLMLLVADAIALAVLVLLQQGKGADVGAAFGSGSASTMFGSAGAAPFFTKLTVWLAIGFFLISFGLAYTAKERASSIDDLGIPLLDVDEEPASTGAATGDSDVPAVSDQSGEAANDAAEQTDAAPAEAQNVQKKLTPESERVDSDIPVL